MAAGQKEAASEALSRWLESLSGRPDAAVDLGNGGAAPASETEATLQVRRQNLRCGRVFVTQGKAMRGIASHVQRLLQCREAETAMFGQSTNNRI